MKTPEELATEALAKLHNKQLPADFDFIRAVVGAIEADRAQREPSPTFLAFEEYRKARAVAAQILAESAGKAEPEASVEWVQVHRAERELPHPMDLAMVKLTDAWREEKIATRGVKR